MSVRIRQNFALFPGVRLNVGKTGVSASIGVPGATVNLGKHGVRTTFGAPGTGVSVSNFHAWDGTNSPTPNPNFRQPVPRLPMNGIPQPITSAAVETLTSASMLEVQTLLKKAKEQAAQIKRKLRDAEEEARKTEAELHKRTASLFRFFYKKRVAVLRESVPKLKEQVEELKAWAANTKVDVTFDSSDEARRIYGELVRAFGALRNVAKTWDITAESAIDRVKTRSHASRGLDRHPARLFLSSSTYINYENSALVFENKNGEDIYIYPGVAVMERNDGAFALIDLRDLNVEYANVNFVEEEAVPGDTYVIKHTWAKVNKDGSPDRRFRDNYQIPVCQYGQLVLRSKNGIREEYQFSTTKQPREFAEAFARFKVVLSETEKSVFVDAKPEEKKTTLDELRIITAEAIPVDGTTQVNFNFAFQCNACGSNVINGPDDEADDGDVTCTGCGRRFGTLGDVKSAATEVGLRDLAEGRVKLSSLDGQ